MGGGVDWTVSADQFQSTLSFHHSSFSIQTLTLSIPSHCFLIVCGLNLLWWGLNLWILSPLLPETPHPLPIVNKCNCFSLPYCSILHHAFCCVPPTPSVWSQSTKKDLARKHSNVLWWCVHCDVDWKWGRQIQYDVIWSQVTEGKWDYSVEEYQPAGWASENCFMLERLYITCFSFCIIATADRFNNNHYKWNPHKNWHK